MVSAHKGEHVRPVKVKNSLRVRSPGFSPVFCCFGIFTVLPSGLGLGLGLAGSWIQRKDPGFRNQVSEETSSPASHMSTKPTTACGAKSTSLSAHRKLFWKLPMDGNWHGLGMSHATTASQKPSFRAPLRVGDAVLMRGNAGWKTSKSGHPCPCQNCS